MQGEKNILNRIRLRAKQLRIKFLELRYALHIRARYIHDTTYQKGGWYKGWTDRPYSSQLHKATFVAFIIAFAIFSTTQVVAPYFFSAKGRDASGVTINLEEPASKEVSWDQYKKARSHMKDVKDIGGGKQEAKIYADAVQYLDDDGQWKDIDTNVKAVIGNQLLSGEAYSGKPNVPLAVGKALYKASFSTNITNDLRFESDGEWITNSYIGATGTPAAIAANKTVNKDAYPKTDIERIFKGSEVKQNIILKEPGHPTEFKEKLDSSLEIRVEKDNSIGYYKGKKKIASTPPITLVDSAKKKVTKKPTLKYENKILTIALPDVTGLKYPLTIDPTTNVNVYGTSGDDTDADNGGATYPTSPSLMNWNAGEGVYEIFLRFSLSGISPTITSASLYIYCSGCYGEPQNLYHSAPMNPGIDNAATLFSTATYNTISAFTPTAGDNNISATTDVQEDKSAGKAYAYFRITHPGGTNTTTYSSADNATNKPYLAVTYVSPPDPPTNPGATALSISSIRWNWTDASSDETGFRVHDAAHAVKCTAGAGATTCDEGSLATNTSYTRHIHSYNAAGDSAASADVSKYTLAANPNVTSDKTAGSWYNTTGVVFTNAAGFGAGGVTKYKYIWDQTATQTASYIDTNGTDWLSGTLSRTMSAGANYLHVTSYNGDTVQNTTVGNYGPYNLDQTPPTVASFSLNSGAQYASSSTRIVTASGIFNDTGGSSGTLDVQFSEDGTNWGVYGSGTTNNKATDWTYKTTVTAGAGSQDVTNAWYLEGSDGAKTVYVRVRDAAGNLSVYTTPFTETFSTTTYKDSGATTANWDTSSGVLKLPSGGYGASEKPLSSDSLPTSRYLGSNATFGYRFIPQVNGRIVSLGRYNTTTDNATILTLWSDGGTQLAQATVSNTAGWQWASIGAYSVTAGTAYRVSVYYPSQGDYGNWGPAPQTRSNIQITDLVKLLNGQGFPATIGSSSLMYGWADIEFQPSVYQTPKIGQSLTVDNVSDTISKATLTANHTLNGQTISYEMSANGGANWEAVTSGVEKTFANQGSDLRWRATLSTSNNTVTPSIQDLTINYTVAPASDSITLDATAPSSPGAPTVSVSPNNTGNQTVSWNAVTETNFANYQVQRKLGAGAYSNIGSPITNIATTSYLDNSALAEGTYYYQVIASDSAGNSTTSSASAAHYVDTTAPSAPTLSCTIYTHNTWSNSSSASTCSITDTATPSPRTAVGYSTDGGTGWTATTGSPPDLFFSFTPNQGTTNVVMRISDTGGGPTSSNTYIIKRDSVAPTQAANPFVLQATSASAINTIKKSDTYYIYGNATDATSGVSTLTTNASSITTGQTAAAMTTAGGPWTINSISYAYRTAQLTADSDLSDGAKSPTLTTTDAAGNTFTPAGYSVTADSAVPTGTVSIAGGAAYTNSASPTLNLTYADGTGSGVNLMQFSNNGTSWGVTTDTSGVVTDTSGNCTTPKVWDGTTCWNAVAATKTGWYLASGADGSRTVYVRYKDNAGNIGPDGDTVTIGTQTWMNKNMDVGTRIDGTTNQTNNTVLEKYCYNNDPNNCTTYGGLYQWDEMMQYSTTEGVQGICPTGFHIPTDAQWSTLVTSLGANPGTKLQQGGTSGFEGLLAGSRNYADGSFNFLSSNGYGWSSSQYDASNAWFRFLSSGNAEVPRNKNYKTFGWSVRCLKDVAITPITDSITLDTTGPTVTNNQAGDDTWRNSNNGTYNVDFADPASGLSKFETKVTTAVGQGGTLKQDWTQVNTLSGNTYDTNWNILASTWTAMQEGTNYVSVRVTDAATNATTTNDVFYVKKDTAAPTSPTISWPTPTSSVTPTLTLSAADGTSGMYQMKFSCNNSTWTSPVAYATSYSTFNINTGSGCTSGDGSKTVYVQFSDNTSNWSSSASQAGVLDTTAPTSSVTPLSTWKNTTSFAIAWSGSDPGGSGVQNYDIQYKKNAGAWTDCLLATALTTITFPSGCSSPPAVANADAFSFQSRARDNAGALEAYPGSADTSTTVDTVGPAGSFMVNNILSNPSFETDGNSDGIADGWGSATAGVTSSIDATTKFYGSSSQKAVFTGTDVNWFSQFQNVSGAQASTPYTASIYIKTDSISTGSGYGVQIEAYSTGAGGTTYQTSAAIAGTTGWTRYTASFTSRSDATTVGVRLRRMSGGGSITGSAWYDAIQLEKKSAPASPYMAWADATTGNNVYSTASDSGSGVYQMWVSNDNFVTGAWEAYNAQKAWTLTTGEGNKTVSMKVKDNAGNEATFTAQNIILDTANPGAFTLTSPTDWAWINTKRPTLDWSDSSDGSGSGLWKYEVYVDSALKKTIEVGSPASTWAVDYDLAEGSRPWYIVATDFTGKTYTTTAGFFTVQIDTIKPTSAISAPTAGAWITTASYNITGTASNGGSGSALSVVDVSTNGGVGYNTATGTASWSYNWTTGSDGAYTIKSRATDAATNVEDVGAGIAVTVDKTPVNASSATVNDGAGADVDWTNSTTSLSANWSGFTDANGIAKYKYAIGTTAGGTNIRDWTDNSTNTTVTASSLTLTPGLTYYFTIKAYDASLAESNASTKTADGISVDTTLPSSVVTIANAYYGPNTWNNPTATISGTAADTGSAPAGSSGITKTEITIQRSSDSLYWTGSTWGASTPLNVGTGGTWTYTLAVGNLTNNVTYTVVSTTTDVAGNVQSPSGSDTFVYDNTTTAPSANVGVNLVKGSSFETDGNSDGVADNWSLSGTVGDATYSVDATSSVFGGKSQKIVKPTINNTSTISQSFSGERPIVAGETYTFSVWVKGNSVSGTQNASDFGVYVDASGGPDPAEYGTSVAAPVGTFGWTRISITKTYTYSHTSSGIIPIFRNKTGTVWFDGMQAERAGSVTDYVDDGYMNEARWSTTAISGTASDAVSGVQKTEITIGNGTNYWTGSAWGASTWIPVTPSANSSPWYYGSTQIAASNFTDGQTMTVTAKTTDNAGNVTSNVTDSVVWDKTNPATPTIASPPNIYLNSSTYNSSGDANNTIRGTASDASSGISRSEITIQRADNNQYWTGSAWSGTQTWLNVGNGGTWNYTGLAAANLANGYLHTINARTYDQANNTTNATAMSFTYDNSGPTPGANALTAAGTSDVQVTLTWNAWTDVPAGPKHYKIERSVNPSTYPGDTADPNNESIYTSQIADVIVSDINTSTKESGDSISYNAGNSTYTYLDNSLSMGWYYYKLTAYDYGETATLTPARSHSKTNFIPLIGAVEGDINLTNQTSNNNIGANKSSVNLAGDAAARTVTFTWSAKDQDHNNPSSDITENRFTVKKPDGSTLETFTGNGSSANGSWTFSSVATSDTRGYNNTAAFTFTSALPYGRYTALSSVNDTIGGTHNVSSNSVNIDLPPTAISALNVTGAAGSSAVLTWNPPGGRTNDSSATTGVASYTVQRKETSQLDTSYADVVTITSGNAAYYSGNTYTYTDGPLSLTSFTYRIKATDISSNASGWTTSSAISVPDTAAPSAITTLAVDSLGGDGTSAALSWTIPSDNSDTSAYANKGVQKFKIYRRTADSGFVSGDLVKTLIKGTDAEFDALKSAGDTITYTASSLSPQTTYHFLIRALDAGLPEGDGFGENETTLTPTHAGNYQDVTTLVVPQGLTIRSASDSLTAGNARLVVSWTPLNASYSTAPSPYNFANFTIERKIGAGSWAQLTTISDIAVNYKVDDHLDPDKIYYYRIKTVNANTDASNASSEISAQPNQIDTEKPTITFDKNNPADLSSTASSITVHFTTSENATPIVEYDTAVNFTTNGTLGQSKGTGTFAQNHTTTLTGLIPSTTYRFNIKASDAAGNTQTSQDTGSVPYSKDTIADSTPPVNPDVPTGYSEQNPAARVQISSGNWYNYTTPYFEWNAGSDADSVISGYLVCFGASDCDPTASQVNPNYSAAVPSTGTYYLRIKTKDAANNTSSAVTLFEYKFDNTAPTSNVASPANGSTVSSVASITGTAADANSNLSSVLVRVKRSSDNNYWNGETSWVVSSNTWRTADSGLGSWTLSTLPAWVSGITYMVDSKATDAAGNEGSASSAISFTYDNVAPAVSRVALKSAATASDTKDKLHQNDTYYIYAQVDEAVGLASATASLSNITTNSSAVAMVSGSWTVASQTYNYRTPELTANNAAVAGNKAFTVTATDNAGQSGQANGSAAVENTAPSFSTFAVNATPVKQGAAVTITFTASETLQGSPSVTVNGSSATYQSANGLDYTYSYTIQASDNDGMAEIKAAGRDESGNDGSTSDSTKLKVDKTIPGVPKVNTVTTPTNANTQIITGTVTDNNDLAQVKITGGNGTFTENVSGISASFSISVTLNQNTTNNLVVTAIDAAGSETAASAVSVLHDSIAPNDFSLTSPTADAFLSTDTPLFAWNAAIDSGSGISYYELWIDLGAGFVKNSDVPERVPAVASPQKQITTALTSGSHSWFVKAFDAAGNEKSTQSASLDLYVDKTKPSSVLTSPTTHIYTNTNSLSITGTASKGASGADVSQVQVSANGGLTWIDGINTGTNFSTWSYSWTTPNSADGEYVILSKAKDGAGNWEDAQSAGVIVTVDKTLPSLLNIRDANKTSASANIFWETNEETTTTVDYGTTDSYGTTLTDAGYDTNHKISLSGLTDGVTYHYRVKSVDRAGNETVSADKTFTTVLLDHIPPVVSSIQSEAGSTTATVTFDTDEVATQQVEYANNAGFDNFSSTTLDGSKFNKDHKIDITSLTHNTQYWYRIRSKDASNNETISSGTDNFTTTRIPAINSLSITSEDDENAGGVKITWTSDIATTSYVEYGLSGISYKDNVGDETMVAGEHTVYLYDLLPGEIYQYQVKGKNNQGNETKGLSKTFVAPAFLDKVPPTITFANQPISGNVGISVSVSSATVKWTTNKNADGVIEYGKTVDYTNKAGEMATTSAKEVLGQNHTAILKKLDANTAYHFRITSRDAARNITRSDDYTFTTLTLGISTPTVSTTSSSARVNWSTVFDSSSYVEFQKQNSNVPSKIEGSGNMAKGHAVSLNNLSSGMYSYKVKSMDADNNIAESPLAFFEIPAADANTISTPQAGQIEEFDITATSAKITWRSSVATTSWVDYGTSSGNYTMSTGNNNMTLDHVITLEGLTPGQTYYYIVRGKDANLIEYKSPEASFIALAKPSISSVEISDITPFSAKVRIEVTKDTIATVNYGKDGKFDLKAGGSGLAKTHEIELKNLDDGANYSVNVDVRDSAGNTATSGAKTFSTPLDTEGPKINEVKIDLLPMGSDDETAQVIISWTTNKPSSTKVEYDEGIIGGKYGKSSIEDESLNNSHTVIVKELNPSATYHFRIVSRDKRNNETKSQDYTFVTPVKEKSILQLILKSLEETFSWVKNLGAFFRNLGRKTK